MENNWAAEHLQTIRTLMERSALYRRALAPIATFVGVTGVVAAAIGFLPMPGEHFVLYWIAVAGVAMNGALLLVRRQALKDGENFWSPPTKRVAESMFPALLVGVFFSIFFRDRDGKWAQIAPLYLVAAWTILYGLATYAGGFFISRGFRLFGCGFLIAGMLLMALLEITSNVPTHLSPNLLMGVIFGGSHLAYGIYLYFTEPRKNEA